MCEPLALSGKRLSGRAATESWAVLLQVLFQFPNLALPLRRSLCFSTNHHEMISSAPTYLLPAHRQCLLTFS